MDRFAKAPIILRPTFLLAYLVVAILLFSAKLSFAQASKLTYEGTEYWVYQFDPAKQTLQLWLPEKAGGPNRFTQLMGRAKEAGKQLTFAMNAGIYEPGYIPSGLHVSNSKTHVPLNKEVFQKKTPEGLTPNFYLQPNGVFYQDQDGSFGILKTHAYARANLKPVLANQSGPMLVIDGEIHPAFNKQSKSTRTRNGVGITETGIVYFLCSSSDAPSGLTNFYNFASCFRDKLKCPNALYFDGDISYMYIKGKTPMIARDRNLFAGIFVITE